MGTYFTLLNALAEDGRLEEAEELWAKRFSDDLESTPRIFFDKMISIYYHKEMHDKLFELGMLDKYDKLKKKYPPPKWEYRYIKGKHVRIQVKPVQEFDKTAKSITEDKETEEISSMSK
ncbi:pentatricopeptide repeat-containing protein At4g21190-like [Hibiscus syriacus]|uniref:pentatricopeptide repeat-containing protein At4g21190-like n=1 Tax=Hibiscus syriacus TaxID=106335 RepID=UPI0019205F56|nr:pentatricopeptide repeat-containing protein At4g21190-like [Hibiscus syriacus]